MLNFASRIRTAINGRAPKPIQGNGATAYRICTRCVMDTTDPLITFDNSGVCHHCRNYEQRVAKETFSGPEGQRRLDELVTKMKEDGKGRDYDCIIGLSGGVDSTTVAYHVKQLGLRPWLSILTMDGTANSRLTTLRRSSTRLNSTFLLTSSIGRSFATFSSHSYALRSTTLRSPRIMASTR